MDKWSSEFCLFVCIFFFRYAKNLYTIWLVGCRLWGHIQGDLLPAVALWYSTATYKSLWSYSITGRKDTVKDWHYMFKQTQNLYQLLFCDVGYVTIRISINHMQLKNSSWKQELQDKYDFFENIFKILQWWILTFNNESSKGTTVWF